MAFKGLEDRLLAKSEELYKHDGGSIVTPNDPQTSEAMDSRFLPVASVRRDLRRMASFFTSKDGLLFLGKQELQQTANSFSETRVINPLFVIANVVPYIHVARTLTGTAAFAAKGNQAHKSPAAYDPKIGGAGRLQHETADTATAAATGKGGNNSLLGRFTPQNLLNTIRGIFKLSNAGSLDIDDRPELHVDGTYFSIAMWHGFQRQYGSRGALENAKASLRVGDWRGALDNLKNAGAQLLIESGLDNIIRAVRPDGRGIPNLRMEGSRYFITSDSDADRYLAGSVDTSGDRPELDIAYLNRRPYYLGSAPLAAVDNPQQTAQQFLGDVGKNFRIAGSFIPNFGIPNGIAGIAARMLDAAAGNAPVLTDRNSAESHMQFPDLSMANRYKTDQHIAELRNHMTQQIANGLSLNPGKEYFKSKNTFSRIGSENNIDPRTRHAKGGYISDPMNIQFEGVPKDGDDIVNIYITDDVNKRIVPFRAFITNIRETVTPETHDARYIGRVERNIVYMGVTRELAFVLRIHAFSAAELAGVWEKINFLTGLCYPAKFDNGFMVPPFVKLTVGDMYKNQPGFFRNVSYDIEDGTPWEITSGKQVPLGVTIQVAYSILDKKQYTAENARTDGFFNIKR